MHGQRPLKEARTGGSTPCCIGTRSPGRQRPCGRQSWQTLFEREFPLLRTAGAVESNQREIIGDAFARLSVSGGIGCAVQSDCCGAVCVSRGTGFRLLGQYGSLNAATRLQEDIVAGIPRGLERDGHGGWVERRQTDLMRARFGRRQVEAVEERLAVEILRVFELNRGLAKRARGVDIVP